MFSGPRGAQSKQHLSLKLFLFFLFFPFPFLSLFSDIFLPRTSRIRSKNTWKEINRIFITHTGLVCERVKSSAVQKLQARSDSSVLYVTAPSKTSSTRALVQLIGRSGTPVCISTPSPARSQRLKFPKNNSKKKCGRSTEIKPALRISLFAVWRVVGIKPPCARPPPSWVWASSQWVMLETAPLGGAL